MKKTLLTTLLLLSTFLTLFAQQRTALIHNGTSSFFLGGSQFTDAYNASVNGDTILLPAGILNSYPHLDKRLTILGVGFHPDSTSSTGTTYISGDLLIKGNADSLFLQGLEIHGSISTAIHQKVNYLTISRCKFNSLAFNGNGEALYVCEHASIRENVFTGLYLVNAKTADVTNNIISSAISYGSFISFQNNVFLYSGASEMISNTVQSYFANNVFLQPNDKIATNGATDYNTFEKNVFTHTPTPGTNTFIDNYNGVNTSTFFVNQSGAAFDFAHDYHLTNSGTYLGTDGLPVGVYGGVYPLKAGFVPIQPHIQLKDIANRTSTTGDLNIHLKVSAQDY